MSLDEAGHQKPGLPGRIDQRGGEAESLPGRDEASAARPDREDSGRACLLRQALTRENLVLAWKRVKANKGSAGVDGLSIADTVEYLKTHYAVRQAQRYVQDGYRVAGGATVPLV